MSGHLAAINGLFLDHPHTGTGVYAREVLSRLGHDPTSRRYVVVGHPEHATTVESWGGMHFRSMQSPLRRLSANAEKLLWEQVTLPLAARRADLLYSPYFSLPLFSPMRTVVTVHDIIPLLLPEYAPSRQFRAYFRLVGEATRRSDAVVTDSHCSARDIARHLGVDERRIHVIHLGVSRRYGLPYGHDTLRALRARLGLPERFILYLGGIDPRKNVAVLLRALRILRARGHEIAPLAIVAGPKGGRLPARWGDCDPRAMASRLGVEDRVVFVNWVTDDDKPLVYAAALAFAFPSRYEGFGLTPLEALASGTPLLCSNASSLPEVTGEAALSLDPDDDEAWADALLRVDRDEALRADLAARGRVQAAPFTWDQTVEGLSSVFDQVLRTR